MASPLHELDRRTRASLAEASVMRRPFGPILSDATRAAIRLETERRASPHDISTFFDALTRFTQTLRSPTR